MTPIDFQLAPFYLAAAMAACWLAHVVGICEGRRTWLVVVLHVLACALMLRFGWLLTGGQP